MKIRFFFLLLGHNIIYYARIRIIRTWHFYSTRGFIPRSATKSQKSSRAASVVTPDINTDDRRDKSPRIHHRTIILGYFADATCSQLENVSFQEKRAKVKHHLPTPSFRVELNCIMFNCFPHIGISKRTQQKLIVYFDFANAPALSLCPECEPIYDDTLRTIIIIIYDFR